MKENIMNNAGILPSDNLLLYTLALLTSLTHTKSMLQHQKKTSFCSWAVADAISRVLENSEELHSWRKRLLSACMKGLIVMYNSNRDESKQEVERSMLLRVEELLVRLLFFCIPRM